MTIDNVRPIMEQQLALTNSLLELLLQEQTALTERNSEQVEQLASQKQQLLDALSEAERDLQSQLNGQSLPVELDDLKAQIKSQLQDCMQQNDINGKTIELSLGSLNRLQNAMVSQRAGKSVTYDGKGKTSGRGHLGKSITA